MDIAVWLKELGLERYQQAFLGNDVDASVLLELTSDDLVSLGVASVGHRRKLLAAVAALRERPPVEADASSSPHAASAAVSTDTSQQLDAERRQVTVLFADLVGYTTLSRELDAEEVYALLQHFFACVDRIVEDYGGTIDKHIGDCVMAVFGAPVAHDNDVERAVRAALALRHAMPELSRTVGRTLAVHVGVASGQVVAGGTGGRHNAYTVTGDSVNLASRLTGQAAAGEVLISDGVHRMLPNVFVREAAGLLDVKGFAEPVRAWRLLDLGHAVEPQGRPFVGRRTELLQVKGVLRTCREGSGGLAIYLRGEAGIGKTRLLEQIQQLAEQEGFLHHTALVLDFGAGGSQDAIRTLVRSLLGLTSTADETVCREAAERTLTEGLLDRTRCVHLNDLLDLPQPPEERTLYEAMDSSTRSRGRRETVAELVAAAARRQPRLLAVEDMHWADALTLDDLAFLSRTVAEHPIVLVMTSRTEGDPLDRGWRMQIDGSRLLTLDLGPLPDREAEMLAATFRGAADELLRRCVTRAAGNPLFLEQLVRHATEGVDQEGVPGSVQSLVLARVDRLPPEDRRALQVASILGQRFSLDALRHLINDPDYVPARVIRHHLAQAEGEDLLFAHALIRDAVYDSLLKSRRRELHQAAAAWFQDQDVLLHAEHLDRADDPAAARAYLAAARAQAAAYRVERALKLAERGLALAAERADAFALSSLCGELLHNLGSIPASMAAYEHALELATDDADRCRVWLGLGGGLRVTDRINEALQLLERAEAAAGECGLMEELARIHHLRGNLYFPAGRIAECLVQHGLALWYAQIAGSPELEARALGGLADAYYAQGRVATAHDQFERCIDIARRNGFRRIEVAYLSLRGITRHFLNRRQAALEDCLAAADLAARVGDRRAEMIGHRSSGQVLLESGELARSEERHAQALAMARHLCARRFEPLCLLNLAIIAALQGRQAEALSMARQATVISRETGIKFIGPMVLGTLALVADTQEECRAALDEGEAILRAGAPSFNYFFFHRDAIEIALRAGEWDEAERHATALAERTGPEPIPYTNFFIARGRALAAYGRGRRDSGLKAELERLQDEAERVSLKLARPALDAALAGWQQH